MSYHWHIEIIPRLTKVAGFEWATGFYLNPTSPEEAAQVLRDSRVWYDAVRPGLLMYGIVPPPLGVEPAAEPRQAVALEQLRALGARQPQADPERRIRREPGLERRGVGAQALLHRLPADRRQRDLDGPRRRPGERRRLARCECGGLHAEGDRGRRNHGHRDLPGAGAGVQVFFIEHLEYFNRPGIYGENAIDYPDNARRFAFFALAAVTALPRLVPGPVLLHAHDWHTALAPVYLRTVLSHEPHARTATRCAPRCTDRAHRAACAPVRTA